MIIQLLVHDIRIFMYLRTVKQFSRESFSQVNYMYMNAKTANTINHCSYISLKCEQYGL